MAAIIHATISQLENYRIFRIFLHEILHLSSLQNNCWTNAQNHKSEAGPVKVPSKLVQMSGKIYKNILYHQNKQYI